MINKIHNSVTAKVISILTLLIVITACMTIKPVSAATLSSSYNILKNQYPEYVQKLKDGGATEADIASFLSDLDSEVQSLGPLNDANFNSVLYEALSDVITWRSHRAIFNAMLESFEDEIDYTLANRQLHPNLLPLRNAVRDSVLGTSTVSPGGASGGGPVPNSAVAPEVTQQINNNNAQVSLDLSSENSISLNSATLNAINSANKTLEIKNNAVTFRLPPGTIAAASNQTISISARVVSTTGAKDAVAKLNSSYKLLGSVFEFNSTTDSSITGIEFKHPVTVTMSYAGVDLDDVSEDELDVYNYDERLKEWVAMKGTIDKANKTITFTTLHFSKYAVLSYDAASVVTAPPEISPGTNSFSDLGSHWAQTNIIKLVGTQAVSGYPDGTFKPDNTITRAEFATILVKAFNLTPKAGKIFADTEAHWARDYIATANAYGIINGYSERIFAPNDRITREQMAVMAVKAAGLKKTGAGKIFADASDISYWAKEAVDVASQYTLISGYSDNTYRPAGSATRAEAVTVIIKALNK